MGMWDSLYVRRQGTCERDNTVFVVGSVGMECVGIRDDMYGGAGYYECVLSVRGRQRGVLWLGEMCVCAPLCGCVGEGRTS